MQVLLRIRHKKCDEKIPSCTPCMATGRKCDFESLVSQSLLQPSLKPNHLGMLLLSTSEDSAHFGYFINVCAKDFSLFFESPVWESIVLQAACTEPCIRHAALAIGAMSRNNYDRHTQSSEPEAREYSMKQYNLALRALSHALDQGTGRSELAALGSITFIAFEVLWGQDMRVKMHIDAAVAIVTARMGRLRDSKSSSNSAEVGYLDSALSQLGAQFSSFSTHSENWNGEGGMARNAKL
ncbi:hypothetical protein UA08_03312 [Talaromyces atroroseus]|uniref:Zn(2)-C6 fungal-type domain-containing protein n=1 Tax=Talaromyces atroroseus TaxID=1441469 RepID=A0A225B3W6_TALAT|nr:hypothetical protein UA08_03312 [Talaromyces atroroseus]OKL61535.1 hypothetical protein UA08_03312 [Talaromyces atroroseus]